MTLVPNETERALNRQYDVYAAAREEYRKKIAEQAARIERLREALLDAGASLAAAISLLERGGKKAAPSDKMFAVMLSDYRKSLECARAALGEEKKG